MRTPNLKVVVDEFIFLCWRRNKFSEVGCESYEVRNLGYKSGQKLPVWGPGYTVCNFEKLPTSGPFA